MQVRSVAGAPPGVGRIGVPSTGAAPAAGVAAAAGRHPGQAAGVDRGAGGKEVTVGAGINADEIAGIVPF